MKFTKKLYAGAAGLIVAAGAILGISGFAVDSVDAITMGSRRDCGYTDVIINCGAVSQTELLQKYDSNNDGRGNRDIQAIFNHYGIYRSDITGSSSEIKKGWLNTSGVISVDGKTVATNAQSLYRVHPGKQVSPVSISGKTYYIGPVANNYRLGADVFVFFKNGVFHAAIQSSCGNPIVAKPEPKPVYKCESLKATKFDRTRYRFTTIASASNGAQIVSYNYDFGDGTKITGGSSVEHNYATAGNYNITVSVNVKVDGKTIVVNGTNCKTTVKVEEEPKYACVSLKSAKISRTKYSFTASATAENGATIEQYLYEFGDGKSLTSNSTTVEHTYEKPGTYTAKVSVNVSVNGQKQYTTSESCKVIVTVDNEPVFKCDSLTSEKIERNRFKFNATATAQHGAEIVSYTYNFGDGSVPVTTTNTAVEYTYAQAGTYTATLAVNFRVNGENKIATAETCKVTIAVDKEPVYKCVSLALDKIERNRFRFNASALAEHGAEIINYTYNFGDGSASLTTNNRTVEHTFAQAGTYTATLTVNFRVNGEIKTATGENCKVAITVDKEPVYRCVSLASDKIERNRFRFNAAGLAEHGAEIVSYTYNFGDGSAPVTTTNRSVEYSYAQAGTYTAALTVNFRVNGETKAATGENCKVNVTVEKEPVYRCDSLTFKKIERNRFKFSATATAQHGAEVVSYTYNFGDGSPNKTISSTSVEHVYAQPGSFTATLTVNFRVNGENKTATSEDCKVVINVAEEPVYRCESLVSSRINRTTYRLTASASARYGADIVSYTYNFGDGKTITSTSNQVSHEYEKAGSYEATLTVTFRVNGEVKIETAPSCKTTINVEEEPVKPVYRCESLTAQRIENKDRTYAYTLEYVAEGGAALDRVVYSFGDGTSQTVLPGAAAGVEYTYAQPGSYTTIATLYFNVPEAGEMVEKTATCKVKVTIEKPEICPVPGKEHLPKDSPECVETKEMCPVPGKEHLPKESNDCYEPCPYNSSLPKDSKDCVVTPPELPKTGLETFLTGTLGLGSISAAGYYWTASRRNLMNALLRK